MCTYETCPLLTYAPCRCSDCAHFFRDTSTCTLGTDDPISPDSTPCKHLVLIQLPIVGSKEAADILGWDRRKVATYYSRHLLPRPIALLASGPIWGRHQIENYRDELRAKRESS